jgi:diacylglycerol kinase family enzyme
LTRESSVNSTVIAANGASRRFAVVLNASSGFLIGRSDAAEAVREAFALHGLAVTLISPAAGDLPTRLALARDSGADCVVVVGGDGTVACAAQVLAGTGMPLGIVPTGTMNLLAKDLGIPVNDIAAATAALGGGRTRAIDVGNVNGRVFLCSSMIGLPTSLARYREAGRGGPILTLWVAFTSVALRMLAKYRPMRLTLLIDGRSRHERTPAITVSVNPLSDGTGRQLGRACLDGGTLAVYIFNRLHLADALRVGFQAMLGRWRGDPAVAELHVTGITISGTKRTMHVMNDGEVASLETPLRYSVRPRALLVLAPYVADSMSS